MRKNLFWATSTAAMLMVSTQAIAIDSKPRAVTPVATTATSTGERSNLGGSNGMGIFGCSSDGNKQTGGAIIGGLLGGLLGNRIAGRGSRTIGTVLGGAIGAAGGSALGCRLQKKDQQKAERSVQDAVATNETQTWTSDETGASGKAEVINANVAGLGNMKFAKGVEPAAGFSKLGKAYQTTATANLRSRPGLDGAVLGQVATGTRVWVPASVEGSPWFLVSDNGVGQGYVSNALLRPAVTQTAANNCKMVKQTVNVPGSAAQSETYQACKSNEGEWVMTRV